jgi:hypothetical protein
MPVTPTITHLALTVIDPERGRRWHQRRPQALERHADDLVRRVGPCPA